MVKLMQICLQPFGFGLVPLCNRRLQGQNHELHDVTKQNTIVMGMFSKFTLTAETLAMNDYE